MVKVGRNFSELSAQLYIEASGEELCKCVQIIPFETVNEDCLTLKKRINGKTALALCDGSAGSSGVASGSMEAGKKVMAASAPSAKAKAAKAHEKNDKFGQKEGEFKPPKRKRE